jgi:ubiquinone/menaquinone biosynthesis C-methylase UbiE
MRILRKSSSLTPGFSLRAPTIFLIINISLLLSGQANLLTAQTDLSEGWEVKEAERQPPKKIMDAIGVRPGMVIGEIGAGRGRFTVYLARETGPKGKIYANDINERSLEYLEERCRKNGFRNVETIIGREDDPLLPEQSLDLAIMVYVYHHLSKPDELLKNLKPSLKPGAILAIVEMRDAELDKELKIDRSQPDPVFPPIIERIERSAKASGYDLVRIETFIEDDYIFILKNQVHDQ